LCNNDVLYILILSNKFDLKQTIRVLHTLYLYKHCLSVYSWQAFPAKSNLSGLGQEPTLEWST
jgi:hypothetical protein